MKKKYFRVTNKIFIKIIKDFVLTFGLPKIQKRLSIYTYNSDLDELHINFIDQICNVKFLSKNNEKIKSLTPLFFSNKNIKKLFELAHSLGFEEANIGFITSLNFDIDLTCKVDFLSKTFADNIIEVWYSTSNNNSYNKIKDIFEKYKISISEDFDLRKYIEGKNILKENLFDKFGCLNSKISKFGEILGIDISSDTKSLKNRIKKFSNDYSLYEEWFKKIMKNDIKGVTPQDIATELFKPVTIIIPCYNSNDTILKTLYSIESQELSINQKKLIDVVVVDDGSKEPVYNLIKKEQKYFSFFVRVIRLEQNSGLSTARNIGILSSKMEFIILLDSDIIIPKNYILEHVVRNQLVPHAIFVSFKQNIEPESKLIQIDNIKKGLESPINIDDSRLFKSIIKNKPAIYRYSETTNFETLNDTNYFKNFGYGRMLGIYDLATMVVGHNMSLSKETIEKCGYFSNHFIGWGLEDSYFGAKLIANGNYIIPVLSSNVYHINHPPRSGSVKKKQMEFKKNIKLYNSLLEQDYF